MESVKSWCQFSQEHSMKCLIFMPVLPSLLSELLVLLAERTLNIGQQNHSGTLCHEHRDPPRPEPAEEAPGRSSESWSPPAVAPGPGWNPVLRGARAPPGPRTRGAGGAPRSPSAALSPELSREEPGQDGCAEPLRVRRRRRAEAASPGVVWVLGSGAAAAAAASGRCACGGPAVARGVHAASEARGGRLLSNRPAAPPPLRPGLGPRCSGARPGVRRVWVSWVQKGCEPPCPRPPRAEHLGDRWARLGARPFRVSNVSVVSHPGRSVPLLSRILPSDACKIYKQGINIRLDTTLIDFTDMKCQRGDLSFIFNGDAAPSESFVVLDNEQKVYQRIHHEESEMETEEEVDILMSSDIYSATLSTKSISFTRAQTGWLFREDKTERVGNFLADFYLVNGLVLESRKRREHLSEEDILRNKAIMESLSKGGSLAEQNFEPVRRQSLTPPPQNTITWEEYISAENGKAPHLGRELVCKESKKTFKATVAMSQEFPLGIESLLNVLEVIAPFKHFNKLREFVQMKLPPGFPVKLDIPVFPTITATVTFQEFRCDEFDGSIFAIPEDYKEDPSRFPDL
ncbi:ankyrin repeat domain 13c [Cricetulus griseus]